MRQAEMQWASPSAVAIMETADAFIAEGRPDMPGKLAHSGRIQLFGGHIDGNETPVQAIRREFQEELGLDLPNDPPLIWHGITESQNRRGEPSLRNVSLFAIRLLTVDDLTMKIPGNIVAIEKTEADLEQHRDKLTRFAYDALCKVLRGELKTD